jgi:hypothetical protein
VSTTPAATRSSGGGAAPDWGRFAVYEQDGVRREGIFFPSGPDLLYGSLYSAPSPTTDLGVVVCQTWGDEIRKTIAACHQIAQGVARLGGAAMVLHWPGTQDSGGDAATVTLSRLADAAADARDAADAHLPGYRWSLAGFRLGAAAAALAAPMIGAPYLAMVQPSLNPVAYTEEIRKRVRRAAMGQPVDPDWAFGHLLPAGLREPGSADQIAAALRSYEGRAAAVRYRHPPLDVPPGVEIVKVWGDWRIPPLPGHKPLVTTTVKWLGAAQRRGRKGGS